MFENIEDRPRGLYVPSPEFYSSDAFSWWGGTWRNMTEFLLPLEEFEELYDSDLLWEWDGRYEIGLDDYEEDVIECDLPEIRDEILERLGDGNVYKAFALAAKRNTGVLLCL